MRHTIGLARAAIAFTLMSEASARADVETFFGHSVVIEHNSESMETTLRVDGHQFLKNDAAPIPTIALEEVAIVGATPVIIGRESSAGGGNACDWSPFIISFPKDSAARLDGPVESCSFVRIEVASDQINFSAVNADANGEDRWIWTPANGIKELEAAALTADEDKGWNTLRERTLNHPSDVFGYGEIARQVTNLLGSDTDQFRRILSGTGTGEFKGDDYVGIACASHLCGISEALIYLSAKDRSVYLAWKPEAAKIIVRPAVTNWPESPRLELKSWANAFK
jgi:hypothetical protein